MTVASGRGATIWEEPNFSSVDTLEAKTATGPAVSRVAQNQIGIDHQAWTGSITDSARAQRTILVRLTRASWITIRSAHDQKAAAVSWHGRVGAFVEEDRVVLDLAIPDIAQLCNATSIARAEVSANPVIVEAVVIRSGAERNTTCAGWRGREQFVTF